MLGIISFSNGAFAFDFMQIVNPVMKVSTGIIVPAAILFVLYLSLKYIKSFIASPVPQPSDKAKDAFTDEYGKLMRVSRNEYITPSEARYVARKLIKENSKIEYVKGFGVEDPLATERHSVDYCGSLYHGSDDSCEGDDPRGGYSAVEVEPPKINDLKNYIKSH